MKKMRSGAIGRRLGPLGLSVVAAAITAAGFAAISLATKDDAGDGSKRGPGTALFVHPPGDGPLENLSAEDRQKLEDFRQCMSEHGAEPPEPPRFDPDNRPAPPKLPNRDEIAKIRQAHDACKAKLPEDLQEMPGPMIGGHGCGPGGPPPARRESGESEGGNQSQDFVIPAPARSGGSTS